MTLTNNRFLYGDIHNHNSLGYGLGSLERSIEIAKTHLDFFAFTGHSSWHDMPAMEAGRHKRWLEGFDKLKAAWPNVQQLTSAANEADDFVSFLGFEWHSSQYGDQCVILPEDSHPLVFPDNVKDLRSYCLEQRGLMIPHHLAYKTGHRGVNWEVFTDECSPVVEIVSEHGSSENDRGGYDYFNHSMGGRVTSNTAIAALKTGKQFGFAGSSDNHRGFPGAYDEGLMGVWAPSLDRSAILTAIRNRRTVALTGDRISVDYQVNGNPMGSTCSSGTTAEVDYSVVASDEIDYVDVILNGKRTGRINPDESGLNMDFDRPFLIRFEFGWGPWRDMDLDRVCDWAFRIHVSEGRLLDVTPCLRSGPFDENRRHRIAHHADAATVQSYTGRTGAYRQNPNQSIVLKMDGSASTEIRLSMSQPVVMEHATTVGQLALSSDAVFTGAFPAESCLFHRPVEASSHEMSGSFKAELQPGQNFMYLHVRQINGQHAWASPTFIHAG
ncbi:MAG: hypothetical protein HKN43_10410 [Rhodothermales bacterium]|nr:hypothetical protein [Rhodothermales bacterium]